MSDLPTRWVKLNHKDPAHVAQRYNYCAYGSNLSLEQMQKRCPEADIVGTGLLRNAELFFAYYAGIKEIAGKICPIGVYKLNARDIATMDRREGMGRAYDRYLVTVDMADGSKLRCFTYVKWNQVIEAPSKMYMETVTQGYRDWNLPMSFLKEASEYATKHGIKRKPQTYSSQWSSSRSVANTNGNGYASTASRWCSTCFQYDCAQHSRPRGRDGKFLPRISLVTGRDLNGIRQDDETYTDGYAGGDGDWYSEDQQDWIGPAHRQSLPAPRQPKIPFEYMTNQERTSLLGPNGGATYENPENGERWAMGSDKVWRRVKE